jgi:hypothetical protein
MEVYNLECYEICDRSRFLLIIDHILSFYFEFFHPFLIPTDHCDIHLVVILQLNFIISSLKCFITSMYLFCIYGCIRRGK